MSLLPVAVVTALEARARDQQAIASGISAHTLMHTAGDAAAALIVRKFPEMLRRGVDIYTGPGNNGGDGWVVASRLTELGISVRVLEAEPAKSREAIYAKASARLGNASHADDDAGIVVDALLGTGSVGAPGGSIRVALEAIRRSAERGSVVVALDIPTGMDATTGEASDPVHAALTISFGTIKRGQLINRAPCGQINIVDIGLGAFGAASESDVTLARPDWVSLHLPTIAADAHKGTRKRLAILAGDVGMAGAAILAGRGALRSGIGLLHLIVARENRDAVHAAIPAAIVSTHEEFIREPALISPADAVVIGPGLKPETAARILEAVPASGIPVVLDAGAMTSIDMLRRTCANRKAVLTPHPAEMGRIMRTSTADVLAKRFDIGAELSREVAATVLLKGTPTIVSHPMHGRMAIATGTAALGTGGSGDILSGMIGTLMAQSGSGFESAVCAAWVHGRAAELCGSARGVTLDDILYAMPAAWRTGASRDPHPVLASLPSVQ